MTNMKISFKRLRFLMVERNVEFAAIRKATGIGSSTITKIKRDQDVALDVMLRICGYFNCNIGDICDAVPIKEEADEG
ncbi:MAG: helix-turn-helix transcriptional regulator [Christensenellaceae bacterium]